MIAADTSSLVAYLSGEAGDDVERIEAAMRAGDLALPPPVVSELLSKPDRSLVEPLLAGAPLIDLSEGIWRRVGDVRRLLIGKGVKAALADALVAQCCIDADAPLIARGRDYRHYVRWCGLKLAS